MDIIERPANWGLRRNVISGVQQVAEAHGSVIVVEDDIVTESGFLEYMNLALEFYKAFTTVGAISGYVPEYVSRRAGVAANQTFFHYRASSWGWATWWDRWKAVDWEPADWRRYLEEAASVALFMRGGVDMPQMLCKSMAGANQSWMARWYFHCFLHGMVTLYPGRSLVDNIGFDGSGTHSRCGSPSVYRKYRTSIGEAGHREFVFSLPIHVDEKAHQIMTRFYAPSWFRRTFVANIARPLYRRLYGALWTRTS